MTYQTHEESVLIAVTLGKRTLAEISKQLWLPTYAVSGLLATMTRKGLLYRTGAVKSYRYRPMTAPDVLIERRARVERMREWAPARLAEMKDAS